MSATKLAEQLFGAFASGDLEPVRGLCTEDFSGVQNGGAAMTLDALLAFAATAKRVIPDFHYEDVICVATDTGFVEEHSVCGTLPDGSAMKLAICVVGQVREGRICALREYADTRAASGMLKALSNA